MWYASSMDETPLKDLLEAADAAVENAQRVRRRHRRRTERNSQQRVDDIKIAAARLREAMRPLKSKIGHFQYDPQTELAATNRKSIRKASAAIQRERRKLWKMRPKETDDAA